MEVDGAHTKEMFHGRACVVEARRAKAGIDRADEAQQEIEPVARALVEGGRHRALERRRKTVWALEAPDVERGRDAARSDGGDRAMVGALAGQALVEDDAGRRPASSALGSTFQPPTSSRRPSLDDTRAAVEHLLRVGAVHLTGDDDALTGQAARARAEGIARAFGEIVAPSFIVRLRCDPLHTAINGAHANAIGATLEASGFASFAAKLHESDPKAPRTSGQASSSSSSSTLPRCDARSAEIIANLADERALYIVASTAVETDPLPRAFQALPPVSARWGDAADVSALTPMGRWCLRAAGVFGWRFSAGAVAELVAGPEADELPSALAELTNAGFIADEGEGRFAFASASTLSAARRLARPSEARLGARLARGHLPRTLEGEALLFVDPSCPSLATSANPP